MMSTPLCSLGGHSRDKTTMRILSKASGNNLQVNPLKVYEFESSKATLDEKDTKHSFFSRHNESKCQFGVYVYMYVCK